MTESGAGVTVDGQTILFVHPDPDGELEQVRLYQEVQRPRNGPDFERRDGVWKLRFPVPAADRIEYLVERVYADGGSETIPDPHNEARAPGAFGDKSVVELESYEPPKWLEEEAREGHREAFAITSAILGGSLPVELWTPADHDAAEPLPLLIAHDGPEYDRYSSLTHFIDRMIHSGRIPAWRVALVAPYERDHTYSASARYTRSFNHEIIPALIERAPTPPGRSARMGMGASLGALAMLHIHRRDPAAMGGLFLQSGSYFRQRFDPQESGFVRFRRVSRFVGSVLTAEAWAYPVPTVITCGTIEENLSNNRAVAQALQRQGYEVQLVENRDGHNWIGWRDTFDPHLADLLERVSR